jgi:hypothetical protein
MVPGRAKNACRVLTSPISPKLVQEPQNYPGTSVGHKWYWTDEGKESEEGLRDWQECNYTREESDEVGGDDYY